MLRPVDGKNEILLSIDLIKPIDWRHQKRGTNRGILEHQLDVRISMQPGTRGHVAVLELDPAADLFVTRHDLGDEIVLFQPRLELGMPPCRMFEKLRRAQKDYRQFRSCE